MQYNKLKTINNNNNNLTFENIKTLTVGFSLINSISFKVTLSILVEKDPLITTLGVSFSLLFFT